MIGNIVTVKVDRPMGSYHPEHKDIVEEKWVVAPKGMTFTKEEIREKTYFQEQYFDSEIRM